MNDDAQILIARLMAHQTLKREDKLVRRVLSDDLFRADVDTRLAACGLKMVDNVYADFVTIALARQVEPKVFGARDVWQNNNFGLARDGVALLVVLWAMIILPKRERQEAHQTRMEAELNQEEMFGKERPLPRAADVSMGISYKALLADFGDKLGKKTRMDMNLGALARLGFIEKRGDVLLEGPLLDLMMNTDMLKDRIINGALADVFARVPDVVVQLEEKVLPDLRLPAATPKADLPPELDTDVAAIVLAEREAEAGAPAPDEAPAAADSAAEAAVTDTDTGSVA
jgi:hypothetical protein